MKIERLDSGSYRIRKQFEGKRYTIILDYKPTQKEAVQLLTEEFKKTKVVCNRLSFENAAKEYIVTKENVLSPSTIRGYYGIINALSKTFLSKNILTITTLDVQREINAYSKNHAPKTVKNMNGFITAVMRMFCPNTQIITTLPQRVRKAPYIPSDEDVKRILQAAEGTKFKIPIILAIYGLRRSEICALDATTDLNGNILTINKALVQNEHGEWVLKTTKSECGTRSIFLPDSVIELIRDAGIIYKGDPSRISRFLMKKQDELGIPRFSLHKLRHYYASMAHSLGIPDQYIMQDGGWKTKSVLDAVYQHAMSDKKNDMQKFVAEYISEVIL